MVSSVLRADDFLCRCFSCLIVASALAFGVASSGVAQNQTVTHILEGAGETLFDAKQDAIRQALQLSLEQLIVVDRAISDTDIIRDRVISTMNGYVESFDLLDVQQSTGSFRVQAEISISESRIQNFVGVAVGSDSVIDGGSLFAEQNRQLAEEQAEELQRQVRGEIFDRLFRGYPTDMLDVELVNIELVDGDPGLADLSFLITYKQGFIDAFVGTLEELETFPCDSPPNKFTRYYERRTVSQNPEYFADDDIATLVHGRSTDGCPTPQGDRNGLSSVICIGSDTVRCFAIEPGDYCESCDFENFKPSNSNYRGFRPVIYGAFFDQNGNPANKSDSCLIYPTGPLGLGNLRNLYNQVVQFDDFWNTPYGERPVYRMVIDFSPHIYWARIDLSEIDLERAHSFVGVVGAGGLSGTSLVADPGNVNTGCDKLRVALEHQGN